MRAVLCARRLKILKNACSRDCWKLQADHYGRGLPLNMQEIDRDGYAPGFKGVAAWKQGADDAFSGDIPLSPTCECHPMSWPSM